MNQFSRFISQIGGFSILLWAVIRNTKNIFRDRHLVLEQMSIIGVNALPLVILISIFTGAIAAWQVAYQTQNYTPTSFIAGISTRIIIIELSPVLTGMVISGRVGASVAAELATMKITEQLDALAVMGLQPNRFLAAPRIIATTIMMPAIVMIGIIVAIFGSYVASIMAFNISSYEFVNTAKNFVHTKDLMGALLKSAVFGLLTSTTGCYVGFIASNGASGVGNATVKSFVISASLVLISDYVFWFFIF